MGLGEYVVVTADGLPDEAHPARPTARSGMAEDTLRTAWRRPRMLLIPCRSVQRNGR